MMHFAKKTQPCHGLRGEDNPRVVVEQEYHHIELDRIVLPCVGMFRLIIAPVLEDSNCLFLNNGQGNRPLHVPKVALSESRCYAWS